MTIGDVWGEAEGARLGRTEWKMFLSPEICRQTKGESCTMWETCGSLKLLSRVALLRRLDAERSQRSEQEQRQERQRWHDVTFSGEGALSCRETECQVTFRNIRTMCGAL